MSSALQDFSIDSGALPCRRHRPLIYALVWLLHLSISRSSCFINLAFALRGRCVMRWEAACGTLSRASVWSITSDRHEASGPSSVSPSAWHGGGWAEDGREEAKSQHLLQNAKPNISSEITRKPDWSTFHRYVRQTTLGLIPPPFSKTKKFKQTKRKCWRFLCYLCVQGKSANVFSECECTDTIIAPLPTPPHPTPWDGGVSTCG